MSNKSSTQLALFADSVASANKEKEDLSSTFADNMSLPIHRWFRYTAGFSASWVKELIQKTGAKRIIDPFCGSGTVLLESAFAGIEAMGVEAHPYIFRIASAKLCWQEDAEEFRHQAKKLLALAQEIKIEEDTVVPVLIEKCYPLTVRIKLEALKRAWMTIDVQDYIKELNWFVITSILRLTSPVGTAQWQYVLPNKSKSNVIDPFHAFEAKVVQIYQDMKAMQQLHSTPGATRVYLEDARNMKSIPDEWADLVITSPPYANNYDYADATRLEMTFWGDVSNWGELHEKVRQYLITACTQNISHLERDADAMLNSSLLSPIASELRDKYVELSQVRLTKGGKKNYHLMIMAYFHDLSKVFYELQRTTQPDAKMCFVIGDSAPYGVYIPVDKWLGELAISAGFSHYSFEKLRDRNNKWKNRKHTVPLQEGRLWINK